MKKMKKLFVLIMAVAMVMGLGTITAGADQVVDSEKNTSATNGSITIENAVIGDHYTLIKLFDVEIDGGKYTYKLMQGKTNLVAGATNGTPWFDVNDSTREVTAKKDQITGEIILNTSEMNSDPFKNWAKTYGEKIYDTSNGGDANGRVTATDTTLKFTNLDRGYYMILVEYDNPDGREPAIPLVTIDTTDPNVVVRDKNNPPEWEHDKNGKVIMEEYTEADAAATPAVPKYWKLTDGHYTNVDPATVTDPTQLALYGTAPYKEYKKVVTNEMKLEEVLDWDISVITMNYNKNEKIFRYWITDQIDPGMTYDGPLKVFVEDKELTLDPENPSNPITDFSNGYYRVRYYKDIVLDAKGKVTGGTLIAPTGTGGAYTAADIKEANGFAIEVPWTKTDRLEGDHMYKNYDEIHVVYPVKLDKDKVDKVKYINDDETDKYANINKAMFGWYEGNNPPEKWTYPDKEKPWKDTKTYITKLRIFKFETVEGERIPLEGAEFTLTGESSYPVVVKGTRYVLYDENNPEHVQDAANFKYWKFKDSGKYNGYYTETDPNTPGLHPDEIAEYDTPLTNKYRKETFTEVKQDAATEYNRKAYVDPTTGYIVFEGLAAGEYTLTETKTPAGFTTIDPITFTVSFDETTQTFKTDTNDKVQFTIEKDQQGTITFEGLYSDVENKSGSELPETGGIGTKIFYALGAVLVLGAVVLIITRRRARKNA